jgi:hypothetical protein
MCRFSPHAALYFTHVFLLGISRRCCGLLAVLTDSTYSCRHQPETYHEYRASCRAEVIFSYLNRRYQFRLPAIKVSENLGFPIGGDLGHLFDRV